MEDISGHPAVTRVRRAIDSVITETDRGRIKVGSVQRRQTRAKICVENAECLSVTKLVEILPRNSEVFVRSVSLGSTDKKQYCSRLDIYFCLDAENVLLKYFKIVFICLLWLIGPFIILSMIVHGKSS